MGTAGIRWKAYHPLLVLAVVAGTALPATSFTALANSLSKDGPRFAGLPFAVLAVACACGLGMYLLQLWIDPNVPRFALAPAALASFAASVVASAGAIIWFLGDRRCDRVRGVR